MKGYVAALAAVLVLAAAPASSHAEIEADLLQRVEEYLNGITTLDAPFTQHNYDGTTSTGRFELKRPHCARISYDDPATIMVACGQKFQLWDAETGQFNEGPVSASPASILLQPRIDLVGSVNVLDVRRDGDLVYLAMEPADEPGAGDITLVFDSPADAQDEALELAAWFVRDGQGMTIQVEFDDAAFGGPLSDDRFEIDPRDMVGNGGTRND